MFELSKGVILQTSILDFFPDFWWRMPEHRELYDQEWRQTPISTIYGQGELARLSFRNKHLVHHEQRHGVTTRITESDFKREELWAGVKPPTSRFVSTPVQWTHDDGVLDSRDSWDEGLQPAVRNKTFGVYMNKGRIENVRNRIAVSSLNDVGDVMRVYNWTLVEIGIYRIMLECTRYSEVWENGVCQSIQAANARLRFIDTSKVIFDEYVPRDDMSWDGFYVAPGLAFSNSVDKMIFLSKLKELTETAKSVKRV